MNDGWNEGTVKASDGTRIEDQLAAVAARRHFTPEAVATMWRAIIRGSGAMAQFSHAEFGGHGQWMRNGMVMVGDMFNHAMAAKVSALCEDLSQLYLSAPEAVRASEQADDRRAQWWPEGLQGPSSSGSQNDIRYAFFPAAKRLVIGRGGEQEVYDTGDHVIGGVSQQQGATHEVKFSSQHGQVDLRSLKRANDYPVSLDGSAAEAKVSSTTQAERAPSPARAASSDLAHSHEQVLETLERLAALHGQGVLSDDEFSAKKAELLGRL